MAIIIPKGGLCNRLRVIFSYLEKFKTVTVYWENNEEICMNHFLDVFKPYHSINFIYEKPEKYDYYGDYGKIKNLNYLTKLIPHDSIKDKIYSYLEKLGKNFDSCHIRRTDHISMQLATKTFINDDMYIQFIKNSKNKVFLATDNPETQKKFIDIFGDKVIINSEIVENNLLRKSTLENAYIDLVLCSLGFRFQGSSDWSTFTKTIKIFKKINYWKSMCK